MMLTGNACPHAKIFQLLQYYAWVVVDEMGGGAYEMVLNIYGIEI
jgi:hypothetical protein